MLSTAAASHISTANSTNYSSIFNRNRGINTAAEVKVTVLSSVTVYKHSSKRREQQGAGTAYGRVVSYCSLPLRRVQEIKRM